jgi:hypothetical protein
MTMNMINYAIKKIEKEGGQPKITKSRVSISHETCISSLTGDSINSTENGSDRDTLSALLLLKLN